MNIYVPYGVNEFIIALGYKGDIINDSFLKFYAIDNDISIDLASGKSLIHEGNQPK
jgi:glucose-1-phosphate cytidylyltransferase